MLVAGHSKKREEQGEIYEVEASRCGELLGVRGEGIGKLIDDSNISDLISLVCMIMPFSEMKILRGQHFKERKE